MNSSPKPQFTCQYSPAVLSLFSKLKFTLALSTYQANKLIFISTGGDNKLVQLARNFDKVMGFQFDKDQLVIATRSQVHLYANSPRLATTYPKKPNVYDSLFLPRQTFYTGLIDIHDVHIQDSKIHGVNTSFSTIVELDQRHNWVPLWTPPCISALASEDRCHLNGFAFLDTKLKYATALGSGDSLQSWRSTIPDGGVLWDVEENTPIFDDLKMPHSPRIQNGKLYFLESAIGKINVMDLQTREVKEFAQVDAFVRGLAFYGEYLFVGKSKLRKSSAIFEELEMAKKDIQSGISIFHIPSKKLLGEINYLNTVEEIYDIQILPSFMRPNILNPKDDYHIRSLSIPNATFWAKN